MNELKPKAISIPEIDAYPIDLISKRLRTELVLIFSVNVLKWSFVRYFIKKADRITVPGMKGLSLYYAAKFFFHAMNIQKLIERTSSVTYNFLMALPPSFLFICSLTPYVSRQSLERSILSGIQLLIHNKRSCQAVSGFVMDFMDKPHYDVLSFGVVMMLFFSSNGMMGLMRSFDKSQTLYRKRTGMQRRWTAIKLTIVLISAIIMGFSVFIIQSPEQNVPVQKMFHNIMCARIISFVFLVLTVFIAISTIYTYAPSLKHRFRFASTGSVYATIASITVTSFFFFLVTNFIHYNRLYGSIGTLIAFMVLVWLNTAIILIGYELNVNLLLAKLSKKKDNREQRIN